METLTLLFFFTTMGVFLLSTHKRTLPTISLMFLLAGATLALTLADPTLDPAADNATYMIMLIIESLFILWGIVWAIDGDTGTRRKHRWGS